ncbi:MAG: hypothetical protein RL213_1791 [Bacteroidota bacterium]
MFNPSILRLIVLSALAAILLPGCREEQDEPVPTNGVVHFRITNMVGNDTLRLSQLSYTNAAGNTWQVDLLKYYVSNITLVKDNGTLHNLKNYDLVDEELPESKIIGGNEIPVGRYSSLRFYVGVDSTRNNSLDQSGDLDPSYGMFWPWNTGYIFFKHEGFYMDTTGALQALLFHYGTDLSLVSVEIPVELNITGGSKTVDIAFDLQSLYDSPNIIDFNVDNYHQSTFGSERSWIEAMKQNLAASFRVTSIR